MNFNAVLSRSLRLRCPVCGKGKIANGLLSTKDECSSCGTDFVVEAGYFLGAIYFNYGFTVLIVLSIAIPLIFAAQLPTLPVVVVSAVFCFLFPLWFFRYARSLWLSLDYYYDQRRKKQAEEHISSLANPRVEPDSDSPEELTSSVCPLCHHRFSVVSSNVRKWSKCPSCFGDVLLMPTDSRLGSQPTHRAVFVKSKRSVSRHLIRIVAAIEGKKCCHQHACSCGDVICAPDQCLRERQLKRLDSP